MNKTFFISANEPFWSLEIDFNKYMHFKTPGGFEITTPIPEGVKAMDAKCYPICCTNRKGRNHRAACKAGMY
ncbi:MAG: hypothetical protein WKF91_07145 [Segetibacter sp.]